MKPSDARSPKGSRLRRAIRDGLLREWTARDLRLGGWEWPVERLRRLAILCGLAAGGVALAALAGWVTGSRTLSGVRPGWIPMAPNTALCFLVLGGGLALLATGKGWGARACGIGAGLALALAALRLLEYFGGFDLGIDGLFLRVPAESLGLAPVGKMSFFTAMSFTLAATALLLVRAPHGSPPRGVAKALAAAVGFMGLTFALGYAYGAPLMYEGAAIPMALNTAMGFVLLGGGTTIFSLLDGIAASRKARETLVRDRDALQARLALLVESVEEYAILMLDADGRVQSWNSGARRILGYAEEEIHGSHVSRFHPSEDAREGAERELRVARDERRFQEEGWRVRKDGRRFWASVVVSAVRDAEGRLVGFAKVLRDVSDRKRQEDEIRRLNRELEERVRRRTAELERANRELEAANRELESFSYSVSHDLRAPLRSISGFSQALLEDQEERLDGDGKGHLRRVCAAAERMGLLIDDLLQLSRIGRASMRAEPVDLAALAREVAAGLAGHEPDREVELAIQEGMVVPADPGLCRILLENLLGNAWKFTGGRPRGRIEVGERRTGDGERAFYVRDDGVGFDMAYADRLFAPFQRLHAVEEFPGTGVGLATVQRIVRRHGGRVWAEAEVGRGAAFHFTLAPARPSAGVVVDGGAEGVMIGPAAPEAAAATADLAVTETEPAA